MSMAAAESLPTPLTAREVERLSYPGKQFELVRGHLVVREPPSTRHGSIAANLGYYLSDFVRRHRLGAVFAQDTGFKISADPDTVRAPDVAFLARERLGLVPEQGYAGLAPDLVGEIISPRDTPGELLAKVAEWLAAGTGVVWVIDPARAEVRIHRADGSLSIVGADGILDGEAVLPGFRCPVTDVLR